jgi:hypothetical protein
MALVPIDDLQTTTDQRSERCNWKNNVEFLIHAVLDVAIAIVAVIVVVSLLAPVYFVAVVAKTVVGWADTSPTS